MGTLFDTHTPDTELALPETELEMRIRVHPGRGVRKDNRDGGESGRGKENSKA